MNKKSLIFLICTVQFNLLFSQTNNNWKLFNSQEDSIEPIKTFEQKNIQSGTKAFTEKKGRVTIFGDERLNILLEKSKRIAEEYPQINGYRVQLFSGSGANSRKDAAKVKSTFLKYYQDTPSYLIFQSPNFKLRVGDFRTRLKALQFAKNIFVNFPSAFIVQDKIELPPIKQ